MACPKHTALKQSFLFSRSLQGHRTTTPCECDPHRSARSTTAPTTHHCPNKPLRRRTGRLPVCRTKGTGGAGRWHACPNQAFALRRRQFWQQRHDAASTVKAPHTRAAGMRRAFEVHVSVRTPDLSISSWRHVVARRCRLFPASSSQAALSCTHSAPIRSAMPPRSCRPHLRHASCGHAVSRLAAWANTDSGSNPCMQVCS